MLLLVPASVCSSEMCINYYPICNASPTTINERTNELIVFSLYFNWSTIHLVSVYARACSCVFICRFWFASVFSWTGRQNVMPINSVSWFCFFPPFNDLLVLHSFYSIQLVYSILKKFECLKGKAKKKSSKCIEKR